MTVCAGALLSKLVLLPMLSTLGSRALRRPDLRTATGASFSPSSRLALRVDRDGRVVTTGLCDFDAPRRPLRLGGDDARSRLTDERAETRPVIMGAAIEDLKCSVFQSQLSADKICAGVLFRFRYDATVMLINYDCFDGRTPAAMSVSAIVDPHPDPKRDLVADYHVMMVA